MKEIKLTLYDWLGYLIPGTILILTIYFAIRDTVLFKEFNIKIDVGFINGFIFFCLSYLVGHLGHSVANLTIDLLPFGNYAPKKYFDSMLIKDFSDSQIETIINILKNNFNIQTSNNKAEELRKNYWLCYTYISEVKPDSLSQTFLNLNGFYRGSSVCIMIASIICLIKSLVTCNSIMFVYLSLILLIASILLYLRAKRFKIYLTRTIYSEFLSLNRNCNE